MRSPLTGTTFALELTNDIRTLPALLIGSVMAYGLTVLVMKRSILTEKLARRGYHISREYSTDPLERIKVGEVMTTDVVTVPASLPLRDLVCDYFFGVGARKTCRLPGRGKGRTVSGDHHPIESAGTLAGRPERRVGWCRYTQSQPDHRLRPDRFVAIAGLPGRILPRDGRTARRVGRQAAPGRVPARSDPAGRHRDDCRPAQGFASGCSRRRRHANGFFNRRSLIGKGTRREIAGRPPPEKRNNAEMSREFPYAQRRNITIHHHFEATGIHKRLNYHFSC